MPWDTFRDAAQVSGRPGVPCRATTCSVRGGALGDACPQPHHPSPSVRNSNTQLCYGCQRGPKSSKEQSVRALQKLVTNASVLVSCQRRRLQKQCFEMESINALLHGRETLCSDRLNPYGNRAKSRTHSKIFCNSENFTIRRKPIVVSFIKCEPKSRVDSE